MKARFKIQWLIVIILEVAAPFLFYGYLSAEPLKVTASNLRNEIFLPVGIPEKSRFTLVSTFPVLLDGETLGTGRIYDDPATKRGGDYAELYNTAGDLLAVSWIDSFGIERLAVDRGVVQETGSLEGVFVILLEGDSL